MHFRKLVLAAATIAAISPSISNASPEHFALQACARAFASKIASPGSTAPSYKLKYEDDGDAGTAVDYYHRQYTFYLQAHDPKNGSQLASATCSTNMGGVILALTMTPVPAPAPALAAKF